MLNLSSFSVGLISKEPSERDIQLGDGMTIKNIPKAIKDDDLYQLLFDSGVTYDHSMEHIHVNRGEKNVWVVIESISSESVQHIFRTLHHPLVKTKFFGANIYCNLLRNTTPEKKPTSEVKNKLEQSCNVSLANIIRNIPGFSKSAKKKALKKAKQKEKAQDQKKAKLTAKDFLNKNGIENDFEFECIGDFVNRGQSKFFQKSPVHEDDDSDSYYDQEEPVMHFLVSQAFKGMRVLSPEEKLRSNKA